MPELYSLDFKAYLSVTEGLESSLVAKSVLSGLHHKRQARVDVLLRFLDFLGGHHDCYFSPPSQPAIQKCNEDMSL